MTLNNTRCIQCNQEFYTTSALISHIEAKIEVIDLISELEVKD